MSVWDRLFAQLFRRPTRPPVRPPEPPELPPPPPEPTPEPPPPVVPEDPPSDGGGGRVIKITDEPGLLNRGYSDRAMAWVRPAGDAYVFVGHADGRPRFFSVRLGDGAIQPRDAQVPYRGEAESWYWDAEGWIFLIDGPRLHRVNPFSGTDQLVFDISERFPGHDLWQANSSDDGQTHSATLRRITYDGNKYPYVGTVVFRHGQLHYFSAEQDLDESQVTRCGNYVVIKEGAGPDNRVITLDNGEIRTIPDRARAMGHSDCGHGIIIGEADKPDPGMCGWWDLTQPLTEDHFHPLFPTGNMGYVSYRGGRLLHSGDTHLRLIDPQTGAATELYAHGGGSDYDSRVKAALSPCGRVASWVSPQAGRNDLYVMVM